MLKLKKLLAIIVALALSFNMLSVVSVADTTVVDYGTCGANLTYVLDSDGVLTISGTGDMGNYGAPGSTVKSPFYSSRSSITSVVIESGVTSIGSYTFYGCTNLESVVIPDGITSIGYCAFKLCTSLTSVVIPDGITSIGDEAFFQCTSLTSVTIGRGITSIGDSTFRVCTSLESIVIPDGVTSIGSYAFYKCASLTSINIPDSVTSIGDFAFSGCSSLTSVDIPNGVTSIENSTFSYCTSLESIIIPDSVTSIGSNAFYECTSLISINIPDGVTSISDYTFSNCTSLTSINIPDSVTSIGDRVFYYCTSLTSINIPDSVTSIGDLAFFYCTSLESIIIPDGVTSIGSNAFNHCTSLTSVDIPESVTSIGESAFFYCTSLGSIVIPDGVTSIGGSAFYKCTSLESIVIHDGVTSISNSAFYDCTSLSDVYYYGTEDEWNEIEIGSNNNPLLNATIHFLGSDDDDDEQPDDDDKDITLPASGTCGENLTWYIGTDGVLTISGNGDMYDYYLNTSIPWYKYTDVITEIVVEEGVTSIGELAFCFCDNVTIVTIADTVDTIGGSAFYECSGITDVYYEGTYVEWNDIDMGTYNDYLLNADIHYLGGYGYDADYIIADVDFSTGIDDIVVSVSTTWDDTWFATDATTYQHDMATTAMALAGATYVADSSGNLSSESITEALTAFNFTNVEPHNYDYSLSEDDNDVVAYTFAYKTMYLDGEYTEVVMIAIKGTSSNEEWYSNFNLGFSGNHKGFNKASNELLASLKTYLKDLSVGSDVKFFVTGHSRGAAVANLVAKDLTDSYGSGDVYAYTFACPSTSVSATSTGYENIVNICSGEDFITTLPLEDWGFGRYGITLNLPSRSYFSSAFYDEYLSSMSSTFEYITGEEFSTYSNGTQQVDEICSYVYSLANSRNNYYNALYWIGVDGQYMSMSEYFNEVAALLINGLSELLSVGNSSVGAYYKITKFFLVNYMLNPNVAMNHCMASYYSWMSTLSSDQLFGNLNTDSKSSYKRMTVACPVDVYVYNENDELVAAVVNGEITVDTLAVTVEDDVKTIDLPCDQEYRIVITAYDEGTVDYTVSLMGTTSSIPSYIAEFSNIEVVSGDELSGTIVVAQSTTDSDYDLTKNQTETLQATVSEYVYEGYAYTVQDITDILGSIDWTVTQSYVDEYSTGSTEESIEAMIADLISNLGLDNYVVANVYSVIDSVAGDSSNVAGTDGSYSVTFTITIGSDSDTLDITGVITATAYKSTSVCTHTTTKAVKENITEATATTDGSYDLVIYCTECGLELSRSHVTVEATGEDSDDTISEEVTIVDPIEDTDTSTEEDEPESEPEVSESETNPTTGIAISLLPMAIAALVVISSKRR
ncbi:MAG: leucine-rich repeat protein [Oscillospiraceae bacterium]|nr:leucine-rich repeat protein [Oscillospiraceae bacterium]